MRFGGTARWLYWEKKGINLMLTLRHPSENWPLLQRSWQTWRQPWNLRQLIESGAHSVPGGLDGLLWFLVKGELVCMIQIRAPAR